MGRPRLWTPHKITSAEEVHSFLLVKKYGTDPRLRQRLHSDYRTFRQLNPHLRSHLQVLEALVGQMHHSGLEPGTVKEYAHIMDCFSSDGTRAPEVLRVVDALATDRGGRGHATDIGEKEANAFGSLASRTGGDLNGAVWLMYVTGLRYGDVEKLWDDAMTFKPTARPQWLELKVRWTKGIKTTKNRRVVKYPLKGLAKPPKTLMAAAKKGKGRHRLFRCSYSRICEHLRGMCDSLRVKPITTGTFRRCFSRRIDSHCRKANIPKRDMMLHSSEKMDQAHYSFDNNPRPYHGK